MQLISGDELLSRLICSSFCAGEAWILHSTVRDNLAYLRIVELCFRRLLLAVEVPEVSPVLRNA